MDKKECKKYIKRACNRLLKQNQKITIKNLEKEMENEIRKESEIYISYAKIALDTLLNSATVITANQLSEEIDVIDNIYKLPDIISKSKRLV